MSFYNPYMQHPDYAGGIEDFMQQLFQMMMYKKYMDGMGGQEKGQEDQGTMWNSGGSNQFTGEGMTGSGLPPQPSPIHAALRSPMPSQAMPPIQPPQFAPQGRDYGQGGLGMQFPQMPPQPQQPGMAGMPGGKQLMPQQQQQQQGGGAGIQGLIAMLMQNPEMLGMLGL